MADESSKPKRSQILRVFGLVRPYTKELIFGMFFLIGGSGVNLLFPEIIRRLLDAKNFTTILENTNLILAGLILLIVIQGLCFYGRSYIFGMMGHKAVAGIRKDLYGALVNQEVAFFDKNRAGDLVSRLASDTVLLQTAVSLNISVLIRYGIQVIVGIILMAWISLRLTLILIALLPVLVGISAFLGKRLRKASKQMHEELGRANIIAEETLYGIRTVKAFVQENVEKSRYGAVIDSTLWFAKIRTYIAAFFASFVSVLMNISIVVVLGFGLYLLKQDSISIGSLTAFLLYGLIVAVSFAFLAGTYTEFLQALGAAERVFEIIDRRPDIELTTGVGSYQVKDGLIEFKNVSFSYPSRADRQIIQSLSFSVSPGQSIALVGPSGGGKTTIVSLLLRYYDPSEGQIIIDGTNIAEIDPHKLRAGMAIVAQDPEIFSVTIEEILRYGKQDATTEELNSACRDANILDFIESLPKKFETHVGDKGVQLSGGQRQRLAIARAILKDPKILILDEATSSLDSANESLIQQALLRVMKGRTTIVVAHRLSTVQNVDRILVIKDGSIIESGKHAELIAAGQLYRELVEKQDLHG